MTGRALAALAIAIVGCSAPAGGAAFDATAHDDAGQAPVTEIAPSDSHDAGAPEADSGGPDAAIDAGTGAAYGCQRGTASGTEPVCVAYPDPGALCSAGDVLANCCWGADAPACTWAGADAGGSLDAGVWCCPAGGYK